MRDLPLLVIYCSGFITQYSWVYQSGWIIVARIPYIYPNMLRLNFESDQSKRNWGGLATQSKRFRVEIPPFMHMQKAGAPFHDGTRSYLVGGVGGHFLKQIPQKCWEFHHPLIDELLRFFRGVAQPPSYQCLFLVVQSVAQKSPTSWLWTITR